MCMIDGAIKNDLDKNIITIEDSVDSISTKYTSNRSNFLAILLFLIVIQINNNVAVICFTASSKNTNIEKSLEWYLLFNGYGHIPYLFMVLFYSLENSMNNKNQKVPILVLAFITELKALVVDFLSLIIPIGLITVLSSLQKATFPFVLYLWKRKKITRLMSLCILATLIGIGCCIVPNIYILFNGSLITILVVVPLICSTISGMIRVNLGDKIKLCNFIVSSNVFSSFPIIICIFLSSNRVSMTNYNFWVMGFLSSVSRFAYNIIYYYLINNGVSVEMIGILQNTTIPISFIVQTFAQAMPWDYLYILSTFFCFLPIFFIYAEKTLFIQKFLKH